MYKEVASAELLPIYENVCNSRTKSSETALVRTYLTNSVFHMCLIYDLFPRAVHGIVFYAGQILFEKQNSFYSSQTQK